MYILYAIQFSSSSSDRAFPLFAIVRQINFTTNSIYIGVVIIIGECNSSRTENNARIIFWQYKKNKNKLE